MIDFNALKAPFPPDMVEWRVGSTSKDKTKGMALAYIDARAVQDRLDEVCGPENWQCRFPHAGTKTVCEIGVAVRDRDAVHWIWKADGAGDTDFEAEKGALSDAFKRAAVKWGIGRYLYDMPAPWVKIDEFKKILPVELERLMSMLPNATTGVKVNGLNGLSKTPAKFWDGAKLIVALPQKYMTGSEWSQEAWDWWKEQFRKGIDKAPTRTHLARYQTDNQHIVDQLPAQEAEALRDSFEIRATQFDEFGG